MGRKRAATSRESSRWPGRQPRRASIRVAGAGLALALLVIPTQGQTHVKGWGSRVFDSAWNEGAVDVGAGSEHSAALRADGSLVAWGESYWRQCEVPPPPAGLSYVEFAGGGHHSLGRRSDGSIVAWGNNSQGQCDVPALPPGITFVQVAAGWSHSAALRSDGVLEAWGYDNWGQSTVPALPPGLSYVQVDAGYAHTAAVRTDGSAIAWGSNYYGLTKVPALPPGLAYVQVAAGDRHTIALLSDGSAVAWGHNGQGQCNVPALPPGTTYVQVDAGRRHSVALRSDGSIAAWGSDTSGQSTVPPLPPGLAYLAVAAGDRHNVAVRSDAAVVAWGLNRELQCNAPAAPPGSSYLAIATGGADEEWSPYWPFYAGLLSDGSIVQWGDTALTPGSVCGTCEVPPPPPGLAYVGVSAGANHMLAQLSDHSLVAWGNNWTGQCDVPVLEQGLLFAEIDASTGLNNLALLNDGSVIAWGNNSTGQNNVPPLPEGLSYVEVSAGGWIQWNLVTSGNGFGTARRSDGSLVAWGDDGAGQCNVPSLPPGLSYVGVSAGGAHAAARRSDGSLVAWGSNFLGQGNVPPLPPGLTYVDVAAGSKHTAARLSDGSLVAWGDNSFGQSSVPALPPGYSYRQVVAGFDVTAAVYGSDPWSSFCTAGTSSAGCQGSISGHGAPSASSGSGFTLTVGPVEGQQPGLIFYGLASSASTPFSGTTGVGGLCLAAPLQLTRPQVSGGTPLSCDGSISLDWNAYVADNPEALGNPFAAGQSVFAQGWVRDPGTAGAAVMSDALAFVLEP